LREENMTPSQPTEPTGPVPKTLDELFRSMLGDEFLNHLNQVKLPRDEVAIRRSNGDELVVKLTHRTAKSLKAVLITVGLAAAGCAGFNQLRDAPLPGRGPLAVDQPKQTAPACSRVGET
jgi:hypothetical protein